MMSIIPIIPGVVDAAAPGLDRDVNAAIVDASASLIVVVDRAGRIVRFNHACEEASGYSFAEVRGRVLWEVLIAPAEAAAAREAFEAGLAAGEFPRAHENDWQSRDGSRRRIVWSNAAVLDTSGQPALIVGCGNDIT